MVPLRPERRAALCGLLNTVLHDTVKDALAEQDSAPSAECTSGAIGAVLFAVQEALCSFAEEWNAMQPGRLLALPPALVSQIFYQLDFAGRLAVSHVCSSWRRAALADCILWAEYSIAVPDDDASNTSDETDQRWDAGAKAHILSLLLERSNPLPFAVRADYVPDAIVEIIIAHMHRMEVLWLGDFQTPSAAQRLLELDVPALKSFFYHGPPSAGVPLGIRPRWADSQLDHLDITGPWLWPAGCVSTSLRTLRGTMPDVLDDNWRLADVFPNLTEIFMLDVPSQAHVDRLEPLPRALVSMTLVPMQEPVDYSALLHDCRASGLHRLHISHLRTPASLHELVALFQRTFSGPWALRVNSTEMLLLTDLTDSD